jgi:hypothetical protein
MVVIGLTRLLRIVAPIAAILLVVIAVEQAPHTVHHLFEPEADAQHECLLAVSAERAQATATEVVVILPVEAANLGLLLAEPLAVSTPSRSPFPARAPPRSAV